MLFRAQDISKSFPGKVLYKNVNLEIERGELVGVFGPKRVGKRTLIGLIKGEDKVDQGKFYFEENDITHKTQLERQHLGIYGHDRKKRFIEKVKHAIKPSKNILEMLINECPKHYTQNEKMDLVLQTSSKFEIPIELLSTRKLNNLSGGQGGRIKLISCLVKEPKLVVIDAPFLGLHYETQFETIKVFKRYYNSLHSTSFILSDDLWGITPDHCDKAYFIENNSIRLLDSKEKNWYSNYKNVVHYDKSETFNDEHQLLPELIKNIQVGNLEGFFVTLHKGKHIFDEKQKEYFMNLEAQWRLVYEQKRMGTISYTESDITINRIVYAIISKLKEL